ncbi:MAG: polyribonucleotide nucleotidyltransferase, partial [Planctomycetes bacterium]|nr:polyribonucleotide nucleotidyltransferase [Planctomycetota bacterium]
MQEPRAETLELTLGGRTVILETGRIARQADAAVLVREGDNAVLVTVVGATEPRPGIDFFPLTVEYREKLAGGGRIPGSFQRREGRISDGEILTSRLIDRSVRPLFPSGYAAEVQIQATVFSAHPAADVESLALLGAGAALTLSDIPFDGPVVGVRSALHRDRTTVLPLAVERDESTADLVVSIGPKGLVMAEGAARSVPDERLLEHLLTTIDLLEKPARLVREWAQQVGANKRAFEAATVDADLERQCVEQCESKIREAIQIASKQDRNGMLREIRQDFVASVKQTEASQQPEQSAQPRDERMLEALFWKLQKKLVRSAIVHDERRLDGRTCTDIRPIWGETGLLRQAHGSALFTRGETQAIVTCTLGSPRDAQTIDTAQGTKQERFLLHYNFPPYSVGEIRALRGPGRREVGHGNLALRALTAVVPSIESFPYTIRIESDITESNGSSSMATVCGGLLALLDAGAPIATPVAGIAMGLIAEGDDIAILSDILGDEDHLGDMDFKLTGTSTGITALQLDNKIGGLSRDVLEQAIRQARAGIDHVLEKMRGILAAPRELPDHAPQVKSLRIQEHMIGSLIGP